MPKEHLCKPEVGTQLKNCLVTNIKSEVGTPFEKFNKQILNLRGGHTIQELKQTNIKIKRWAHP